MGLLPNANDLEKAAEKLVDYATEKLVPVLAEKFGEALKDVGDGLKITVTVEVTARPKG